MVLLLILSVGFVLVVGLLSMVKIPYDKKNGSRSLKEWGFGRPDCDPLFVEPYVESDYEKRVRLGIVRVDDL